MTLSASANDASSGIVQGFNLAKLSCWCYAEREVSRGALVMRVVSLTRDDALPYILKQELRCLILASMGLLSGGEARKVPLALLQLPACFAEA